MAKEDKPPEEERLSAGEIFEELDGTPIAEAVSQVIVPKKGKLFEEDGSMRVAIIRPCVSRGKKIRGLPPIYPPKMLAESAAVFSDWPMYQDHMAEQALESFREQLAEAQMGDIIEFLEERARRIKELGGRVAKSFWNPDIVFEDDSAFGYQRGGVEGSVIPQKPIREMLESDPKILNVSINAWPTGARPGVAPWDAATKGMLIEGIRPQPRGSVDWVFRGGAGGRPLLAEGDLAVSVLEAYYSAEHGSTGPLSEDPEVKKKLSELKPGELREYLQEEAPHLVEALGAEDEPESTPKPTNGGGITEEQLRSALKEQREELVTSFDTKLEEREEEIEEQVKERLGAHTLTSELSAHAFEKISEAERNGLPKRWGADLRQRYSYSASGVGDGLRIQEADLKLTEEEDGKAVEKTVTPKELIEHRVREDVRHCVSLMESVPGAQPRVSGLGPADRDPNGDGGTKGPVTNSFRNFLHESNLLSEEEDKDGKKIPEDQRVKDFVGGGS